MTAARDYPDWQAFPTAASGNLFAAAVQTLAPGTTTAGPVPVGSWSALALNVRASAGACKVRVHHWADAAATVLIGGDSWPVRTVCQLLVITPLRGPYVSVDIAVTSAGALTANTWMQFRSAAADRISFPVGFQGGGAHSRTLAASGTDFYDLPSVCAGRAFLTFLPADNLGKLQVRVYANDELGSLQFYVDEPGSPTTGLNQLLEIPDLCCGLQIDNTDAAGPHTYDAELFVPPQ